ncbi:hypothetical protein EWM64_g4913 [Hericium alpestre]|uniref:Uncharacterized protein n=1 Tax=Hericium alpestre TaxID=135208 RepID=A0A4Y9ZWA6_9AGAM|nr:hypothetical protein EWM64_g4913 [Hericium alpestre]
MDSFHILSVFHSDDGYTIGLKLWQMSSVFNSSIFHPLHDPDLFISLHPPFASEYFPEPIEAMCDMLPLDNIRVVIFQDCSLSLSDHEWKFLFETNCQQVSSIFVGNQSDAHGLCEAMRPSDNKAIQEEDGQERASMQAQVFLPDLELLEVESVDFRPYSSSSGEVLETGQLYVDTFTQRRMMGKPISTIRLGKGCVIDAARLDALKAVIHVECDPDAIEEIPKAPHGLPEGVVYPDYIMNPEQEE